jgi:hypothetical protein
LKNIIAYHGRNQISVSLEEQWSLSDQYGHQVLPVFTIAKQSKVEKKITPVKSKTLKNIPLEQSLAYGYRYGLEQ